MRKIKLILIVLWMASLACTINYPADGDATLPPVPNTSTPGSTPTPLPSLAPMPTGTIPAVFFPPAKASVTPAAELCFVNTTALNVRACAGLHCGPVAWLHAGDVVTITQRVRTWWEINTGDLAGFVKSNFCEVKP